MLDGAISGIVTLGNGFEITMYYVPSDVRYEKIECIVDNEQIPENYLAYYDTEYYKDLINEAGTGVHSAETPRPAPQHIPAKKKAQSAKKKKVQKTHHYSPEQEALRKGFLYNLGEKIADRFRTCSKESMEKKKLRKHRKMKLQVKKKLLYFMKIMTSLSFSIQLNQKLHIYSKWKQTVK